ncbi:hypothetical protein DESA109040_18010 [Deinococcus saxicola]
MNHLALISGSHRGTGRSDFLLAIRSQVTQSNCLASATPNGPNTPQGRGVRNQLAAARLPRASRTSVAARSPLAQAPSMKPWK